MFTLLVLIVACLQQARACAAGPDGGRPFREGDRVQGLYSDGKRYPATITAEMPDGRFQLRWGFKIAPPPHIPAS